MLELIAVMELGVVGGSIHPHFVDDFEPAVTEPAYSIGVAVVLLAVMLIVNVGPDTTGEALLSKMRATARKSGKFAGLKIGW